MSNLIRKSNMRKRRGQSLVEFGLAGLMLVMLLAAALDLGRVFYTYLIVQNMAGEGAAYVALVNQCAEVGANDNDPDSIWGRAAGVADTMGRIVTSEKVTSVTAEFPEGRAQGKLVRVEVAYRMDDLFLPGLFNINTITLQRAAEGTLVAPGDRCS